MYSHETCPTPPLPNHKWSKTVVGCKCKIIFFLCSSLMLTSGYTLILKYRECHWCTKIDTLQFKPFPSIWRVQVEFSCRNQIFIVFFSKREGDKEKAAHLPVVEAQDSHFIWAHSPLFHSLQIKNGAWMSFGCLLQSWRGRRQVCVNVTRSSFQLFLPSHETCTNF